MSLQVGSRLGPYEILSPLGAIVLGAHAPDYGAVRFQLTSTVSGGVADALS